MKKTATPSPKPETAAAAPATPVAPAAPAPTEAVAVPPPPTPEQLEELRARAARADEHWDRLLRTAADLENYRKRAARERIEAAQSASAALLQKLLPVLDHFELAQSAARGADAPPASLESVQAGIALIQQQLRNVLSEAGLEEIDARGRPFDPMLHEAVAQLETAEAPDGQVVQQIRKGYKFRERLLRPATVVVARKPAAPPAA